MTNEARCAGKLARAAGPIFEAKGELAAQRRHSSCVIGHSSSN
jgi:hypothetical protein